jgi:hypothetical protein
MKEGYRIIAVVLGLVLALVGSQVGATGAGGNLDLAPHPARQPMELCYDSQIDIYPPTPTDNDVVQITSSGLWCDSCVPGYQSHEIVGKVIRIYAVANPNDMLCLQVLTPW